MSKLTTKERVVFGLMPLDELVNATRNLGILGIGANNRLLLTEFSRRLGDTPTDAVSLAIVRNTDTRGHSQGFTVWHWGIYSPEKTDVLREMPGRWWNGASKVNSFPASSDNDPAVFGVFNKLYAKTVVITESGYRIDDGLGANEWKKPTLYQVSDQVHRVNLADVFDGFKKLRPNDEVSYVALHGEYDEKYRTLFDESLRAERDRLAKIELQTRHEMLMFRLPCPHGKPRYLVYSAAENSPLEVVFADSTSLRIYLAAFKEAQQRHGVPLLEGASMHEPPRRPMFRRGLPTDDPKQ